MDRKDFTFKLIGISLNVAFILAACNASATPAAQATQTASPVPIVPTETATVVPTVAETAAPTVAPTPTTAPTVVATSAPGTPAAVPTLQSSAAQVVPTLNAYCRKGPGTSYDAITFLQTGSAYNVTGRISLNTWWQVQAPGNVSCWVGDATVSKQGPVEQVAIVQAPALPGVPADFVNSYVCDTVLKTLGVSFNWAAATDVTGYYLYRNGDLLIQLGPDLTSYHDAAPLGMDLVYELEAFNNYGVAARVSTKVPTCQ